MNPSYRPRNRRRVNKHGFRARMATRWGRATLSRRRKKGRKRLTVKIGIQARGPANGSERLPRSHRLARAADLEALSGAGPAPADAASGVHLV